MQLYALDDQQHVVLAKQAVKQQNYICIECQQIVRVRAGVHRQAHYYHLAPTNACRQHSKSLVHLQIQSCLQQQLPTDECQLECRFPAINRVADAVWHPQKLIFEIQCSHITLEEIRARNHDYAKIGFQVIWILHDRRYNQRRLTAAELFLRSSPFYFTNIDANGYGTIYDQFDLIHHGRRVHRSKQFSVNLTALKRIVRLSNSFSLPQNLLTRFQNSSICFQGDLLYHYLFEPSSTIRDFFANALKKEEQLLQAINQKMPNTLRRFLDRFVIRPYYLLFQLILEKACK